jgi:D-alanine-D-alanine ligase
MLIAGGMSSERDVSLSSSAPVIEALKSLGYQVTVVNMGADIAQVISEVKPNIVYNSLHGTYGEDGCLQGLLNIMRVPYTHSGVTASAVGFCKVKSREVFLANNVKVARGIVVSASDNVKQDPMQRPYVIKPLSQGSSVGIHIVFTEDNFDFGCYDFPYGDKVIVEEYIKGREMQVAVLNGRALGVLEIQLLKRRFYDYDTKYTEGFANHLLPAPIDHGVEQFLLRESERIYSILGCNGIARVEFIYQPDTEDIFTLEINTHPGMTPLSICPEIAAYKGINFIELVEDIVQSAKFE